MLRITVSAQVFARSTVAALRRRWSSQAGQSTAEYALVLLGAAGVALLLVAWATKTDKVTHLLNSVMDRVLSAAT